MYSIGPAGRVPSEALVGAFTDPAGTAPGSGPSINPAAIGSEGEQKK